jgi:CRISPR-associated protein Cmr4
VSDDNFAYIAKFATPVAAHIAIDNERKIPKQGALWYEETLPPDTVLYVCLHAQSSRKKDGGAGASQILEFVKEELFGEHPYFRLGGNETVGMGWCKAKFIARQ